MENTSDNQTSKIIFITIQDNEWIKSLFYCAIPLSSFDYYAFAGTAETILK